MYRYQHYLSSKTITTAVGGTFLRQQEDEVQYEYRKHSCISRSRV